MRPEQAPRGPRRPRGRAALLAHPPTRLTTRPGGASSNGRRPRRRPRPSSPLKPPKPARRRSGPGAKQRQSTVRTDRSIGNSITAGDQPHGDRAGNAVARDGEHLQIPESDDEESGGDDDTVEAGSAHNEHWLITPIGAMIQPTDVRTLGWRGGASLPLLAPGASRRVARLAGRGCAVLPLAPLATRGFRRAVRRRPPMRASGAS